ncbi:MAG: hypothetical protein NTV05_00455 [Acidobacteria bacterium]|nr:hypothetical protein [Acidobacteriota bacterium]
MFASLHDADFGLLEAELRKLESEYNMFFAGRLPRPPWETRATVQTVLKRLERALHIQGAYAERFRFQTIQARYATFTDLWDRGLRAREEGRPGPFVAPRRREAETSQPADDRIVHVTLFAEPIVEADRLHELYNRLTEVRRELGEAQIPFHKFAGLIRDQVSSIQQRGAPEVAFRLAVRGGKLSFTARGLKGAKKRD